jgi:hypothetical protein
MVEVDFDCGRSGCHLLGLQLKLVERTLLRFVGDLSGIPNEVPSRQSNKRNRLTKVNDERCSHDFGGFDDSIESYQEPRSSSTLRRGSPFRIYSLLSLL